MSGGHARLLAPEGPLHHLPGAHKIAATFAWVLVVTLTPRDAFWAFGAHALCILAVIAFARLPLGHVARRLAIEIPFVAFACALPIIGRGERVDVLGVSLSERGLWAMWAILAKATLGVAASIVLASTTSISELLRGLERLRVPALFVGICGFMIRYTDVLLDELRRMRIARLSRGHDPRWLWQSRAIAATAGTLFVRSFERGERVHVAMLSRGYAGRMPAFATAEPDRAPGLAFVPVVIAIAIVVAARTFA
jgi:cobalt/nickel transport system permease protein